MKESRHLARGWRMLTVVLLGAAGLTACADGDMAEDEVEPAVDPEVSVATEEGVADVAYFTDWDMDDDDLLAEDEFTTGLFGTWDYDDDDLLAANEFDTTLF